MNSLNALIKEIKAIANSHAVINTVGYGDMSLLNDEQDIVYTLFWFDISSGQFETNVNGMKVMRYNTIFMCLDLPDDAEGNEVEILSDTMQVIQDVVVRIDDNLALQRKRIRIENPTFQRVIDKLGDDVAGWVCECEITIPYSLSECGLPFNVTK